MPGRGAGGSDRGATRGPAGHVPVLLNEILEALAPEAGKTYVDGTFGAGGYSRAILQTADCRLIAIDRDPDAARSAARLQQEFPDRFRFIPGCFGELEALLAQNGIEQVDGIVLDIGVSSMQLDEPDRGFSFMHDGPLDMRMSRRGLSAADVVNQFKEADIARIIAAFGEERRARIIARAICAERLDHPFTTTLQLADLITSVLGRPPAAKIHPATRTFQALRIYVNRELEELAEVLCAAERLLRPGGRLVVVSFHSLEDRIVKQFMALRSTPKAKPSRHLPQAGEEDAFQPSFSLIHRKAITAREEEQVQNPRARSARLRAAVRLDAPAHSAQPGELKIPHTPEPD